jgi:hypothetical protein
MLMPNELQEELIAESQRLIQEAKNLIEQARELIKEARKIKTKNHFAKITSNT